ncbi:MAG TPA: mycothiol synthase [Actinocrinis sp.]|jgi:mycothiol synthase
MRVEAIAGRLTPDDREAVERLLETVAAADGVMPVNENARLAVANGREGATHLLWRGHVNGAGEPGVFGYAFMGPADEDGGRVAELCVAPHARRHGIGTALVEAAVDAAPGDGALSAWAHGDLPEAGRLAVHLGFTPIRELRIMELELAKVPAESPAPEDTVIRTFRPGQDEEAWLELNTAAFAHHPEQGAWTRRDLDERMTEPWFDPAGFFLAERAGRLVGFHWTKVHAATDAENGGRPVGEIYVLGVAPDSGSRGLGRALALAGLHHLRSLSGQMQQGMDTVILYVEGDNAPALHLYEALGFHTRSVDVLYEGRKSG